jgi:hypothetical protein
MIDSEANDYITTIFVDVVLVEKGEQKLPQLLVLTDESRGFLCAMSMPIDPNDLQQTLSELRALCSSSMANAADSVMYCFPMAVFLAFSAARSTSA